jgi:DNA-binding response OmpR family regulator
MACVMVVEDDRSIADLVALYLRKEGHQAEIFQSGSEALRRFESERAKPDLIVLDLMLPGLDGRGIARRVRAAGSTPIIMLTALDDDRDIIEGLDLGADDYLTKPFNPDELVARVRAILRRSQPTDSRQLPQTRDVRFGNTCVRSTARRVFVDETELSLRTKEFDLLAAFIGHIGVVLTRDQLLERVWGGEFDGDTRTVDVHISRLRERLQNAGASIVIETIRSVGYRCTVPQ